MSDTPRTDAEADDARNFCLQYDCQGSNDNIAKPVVVSADFARQLERELAAAKALTESNGRRQIHVCMFCGMESETGNTQTERRNP